MHDGAILARVEIRPLAPGEVASLEEMNRDWPLGRPMQIHLERLSVQQAGGAIYLIAWDGDRPVGHIFLRFGGGPAGLSGHLSGPLAQLSDLFVVPDCWSQGIGSRLMEQAERIVAARGFHYAGLNVATDNPMARGMYERRGYVDAELGEQPALWSYIDPEGNQRLRSEVHVYMLKRLTA